MELDKAHGIVTKTVHKNSARRCWGLGDGSGGLSWSVGECGVGIGGGGGGVVFLGAIR